MAQVLKFPKGFNIETRSRRLSLAVFLLVSVIPSASAAFLHEGFEGFTLIGINPQTKPSQTWYSYADPSNIGNVTNVRPGGFQTQWLRVKNNVVSDASPDHVDFSLTVPVQVQQINFTIRGQSPAEQGGSRPGTMQWVQLESSAPRRELAQFYVFCNNATFSGACEFRVRWQTIDTTGQVLINSTLGLREFNVTLAPNWLNANYDLHVNGVDDGIFPFMDLPGDFQRLRINQYRPDVPMNATLDNWDILGGSLANATVVVGDVTGGILGFASDMHFTSSGSLFFYGLVVFVICLGGVLAACYGLGKSNAIAPAAGFFAVLLILWLVSIEVWPNWIGISMIIAVAALVGLVVRRFILGIRDSRGGAALAIGCMGYFIIASTMLGFSGYAAQSITIPTGQANGDSGTETHTFVGAVADCIITLFSHCTESSVSTTWKAITNIVSWVQGSVNFLFQLLTFQLPIPVVFNMLIVLPPAVGLVVFAYQLIRGASAS